MGRRRTAIWTAICAGVALIIALLVVDVRSRQEISLAGAVIIADADPRKQLPVPNTEITAKAGDTTVTGKSDSSGFFRLNWPTRVWRDEQITLAFRHPDYQPLVLRRRLSDGLFIARMIPSGSVRIVESDCPEVTLADIVLSVDEKSKFRFAPGATR